MITGAQIKAGRRLLKWQHRTLVARSGVEPAIFAKVESHEGQVPPELEPAACAMKRSLEAEGVEFLADGGVTKVSDDAPTITPDQIKAARKILGWSGATLAKRARQSIMAVARAENGTLPPHYAASALRAIQSALTEAGIELVAGEQPEVRVTKANGE